MGIAEPEKRLFNWVAPVGEEDLCDVVGGGDVEGLVVGLEVVVEEVDVDGEEFR